MGCRPEELLLKGHLIGAVKALSATYVAFSAVRGNTECMVEPAKSDLDKSKAMPAH